ncbi:MAG TPA: peptidase [Sphingobium sp.]|uniref:peptidase n=1 Tax=unclassified Sphingobium TaxID=2611147 RepID=UPI0007F39BBB|nr:MULTISPECIES: peptidase [unclassified Sphingobium]OAN55901.1 peptidase [Sphingobium sp. TCM1]WIW87854.1 peptidase [Sphingobium sp. V4]HAF42675.1 peptidase [Sphingobium sp.]
MTGTAKRFLAVMGLAGALALGGCAYDDGYGYGGVSVGSGYYGGGYYDPYYSPGYYPGGYGWYDGFYYPGNGYYVYDRGGRRHRWNDGQRRYWEGRRAERRDDRWQGRDRDGRRDWRGNDRQADRDGRPGNWTRPRPDADGNVGRGRWRGNDGANAVRPAPQPRPQMSQPRMSEPRAQREWGNRPSPGPRADRPMRSGGGRDPAARVRPD